LRLWAARCGVTHRRGGLHRTGRHGPLINQTQLANIDRIVYASVAAAEIWRTYDIIIRGARYDAGGETDNAAVTVVWNGAVVHNDAAIDGSTGGNFPSTALPGAIRLQNHGDAGGNPRFRSIWIGPIA
jgi:hypothetical protein